MITIIAFVEAGKLALNQMVKNKRIQDEDGVKIQIIFLSIKQKSDIMLR